MTPAKLACTVSALFVWIGCGGGAPDDSGSDWPPQEGVYGVAPAPVGGTPSVVLLSATSEAGERAGGAEREPETMDQLGLRFTPSTLMVRVGRSVVFTNSENTSHNVHVRFSDGDSTVFNVDTDPGQQAEFRFQRPGGYHVSCEVHPSMRAFIFVTTTPHAGFADRDGRFHLTGVPPGSYTLSVWSVDPEQRTERTVEVGGTVTEVPFGRPGA